MIIHSIKSDLNHSKVILASTIIVIMKQKETLLCCQMASIPTKISILKFRETPIPQLLAHLILTAEAELLHR